MASGWFDNLRRMMGWLSSVPLVGEELASVDCESVWNASGRATHGKANGRTTIGNGMQRATFARMPGRTAIGLGRKRTTTARIDA